MLLNLLSIINDPSKDISILRWSCHDVLMFKYFIEKLLQNIYRFFSKHVIQL